MLRIYPVLLGLVRTMSGRVRELERHDADLARQCRRALTSAPLNVAEGSYSRGKNRQARYHTALGSLREVLACFEVAEAMGYTAALEPELRARFDHVLGTLVKPRSTRRRGRVPEEERERGRESAGGRAPNRTALGLSHHPGASGPHRPASAGAGSKLVGSDMTSIVCSAS